MEEILNNIVRLPQNTKIGILVGVVVGVTALNYFVYPGVSDIKVKIQREKASLAKLETEKSTKQTVANNLEQYKREMEQLEQQLKDALSEMPEDLRMDTLLSQLHEVARKAGLALDTIEPKKETKAEIYYRIPVKMSVSGSYNEIGVFLDLVGKLRRIVNVSDIKLATPKRVSDKIVLDATYLATTFRFAGETPANPDPNKKAP